MATSASTTTITTTTASLFDHAASEVVYSVVSTPGVLRVLGGTGLPPVASRRSPWRPGDRGPRRVTTDRDGYTWVTGSPGVR